MAFRAAMIGIAPAMTSARDSSTGNAGTTAASPGCRPTTATCRPGCAACCTAPSISSAIPGMPHGKPAGVPCVQLDPAGRCRLFGQPGRPAVCASLQPSPEMCGSDRDHAPRWLTRLEAATGPASVPLR